MKRAVICAIMLLGFSASGIAQSKTDSTVSRFTLTDVVRDTAGLPLSGEPDRLTYQPVSGSPINRSAPPDLQPGNLGSRHLGPVVLSFEFHARGIHQEAEKLRDPNASA